jgi:hypothetical protein
MLARATHAVAAVSDCVLLVARNASSFSRSEGNLYLPLDLDWNATCFQGKLEMELEKQGNISRALLWLHQPPRILPWLLPRLANARVVLVLGSVHRDLTPQTLPTNVVTVRLGSKPTTSGRRWLTHAEISAGAIDAMEHGKAIFVGDV